MRFPPDQPPGNKIFEIQMTGFMYAFKNTVFLWLLALLACGNVLKNAPAQPDVHAGAAAEPVNDTIVPAANRCGAYVSLLEGKKIGVVANQTSVIYKELGTGEGMEAQHTHLVDSLLSLGIDVRKVFAPEHGFRGVADAGEHLKDGKDTRTGLPIVSLYGSQRKPGPEQLQGIDMVVFDIQDVGVRFYTFIATLQLVMEACAADSIPVLVLDRPNPNGHYVDGPTMEDQNRGFLGMTPIPLVYGMTIGEYAQMINEEGWLADGLHANLTVVPLENYRHESRYILPIRPSPNLPNSTAINLYPSLGLFEGTNVNAGRGTEYQFQRYGAPFMDSLAYSFSYIPMPNFGSKSPKHEGKKCFGRNLAMEPYMSRVSLQWLLDAYSHTADKSVFFNSSGFTKHAGTDKLQQQVEAGLSEADIRESWQEALRRFKIIRARYLLYP
jgi:uncharacterized protein YbbC (DUF1343 family)